MARIGSVKTARALACGAAVIAAVAGSGVTGIVSAQAPRRYEAEQDVSIEAPRVLLNTAMPDAPASGRRVIAVAAGGNLQAALNAAQPGDVIELARGGLFTGNFVLPNKKTASTSWIVIRPANFASLPAEGTRMTPAIATSLALPRVQSPNSENAFKTELGAHHYRLTGLNVGFSPGVAQAWAAITLGEGHVSMSDVAHDLVLDRLFIHGTSTMTLRRCIVLNSAASAVIDSWVSDCHEQGADSQAIAGWNGPGPFKIVNNYLEGAGENMMFGGGDPSIQGLVPSDIEIRRNHFFKPLAWKPLWTVKNLLELKNAQRVLIEGNIFENCWANAQNGTAIAIKSSNQSGKCPWCISRDVNVRLNLIRNVGGGFNIAGADNNAPVTTHARNIAVVDNVVSGINVAPFDGDGRGMIFVGDPSNLLVAHNTIATATTSLYFAGIIKGLIFRDNILVGSRYAVIGDGMPGGAAVAHYGPGASFIRNVVVGGEGTQGFPPGNFTPATVRHIGFEDMAAANYRLARNSPYERATDGGQDAGANITALEAAIKGVRVP